MAVPVSCSRLRFGWVPKYSRCDCTRSGVSQLVYFGQCSWTHIRYIVCCSLSFVNGYLYLCVQNGHF